MRIDKFLSLLFVSLSVFRFSNAYIRVSVMLPLDTFTNNGTLNNPQNLQQQLNQLKSGGIDGVMVDVWWGLVETQPQQYDWTGYQQLAQIVKNANLKLQCVMSFHKCGTNVGDACYIPLPQWALDEGKSNPAIFYTDSQGQIDEEYISLGADNEPVLKGRTPVQVYRDLMQSFATNFSSYISSGVINQIQVGLGPAGELRYPSYQLQDNRWHYCGIGAFQSYDNYMKTDLQNSANQAGNSNWGHAPTDAGFYNSDPSQTQFFSENNANNYASDYGKFFLGWYAQKLIDHGNAILSVSHDIFAPLKLDIAAKVSGIHWWYGTYSHAAECTAGYFNTDENNAYLQLAKMFAKYNADFDFTCLEMFDNSNCNSQPQELVKQTIQASQQAGIAYAGENALPICSPNCYQSGFDQIVKEATQYGAISRFTYLRLDSNLLRSDNNNWQMFTSFVQRMHNA